MNLEQVQTPIDGLDQADTPGQKMEGADAAVSQAVHAVRDLVMNVAGREHGSLQIGHDRFIQTPFDATLAVGEFPPYDLVHSKSLLASGVKFVDTLQTPEKCEGFEFFQKIIPANTAGFACSRIR